MSTFKYESIARSDGHEEQGLLYNNQELDMPVIATPSIFSKNRLIALVTFIVSIVSITLLVSFSRGSASVTQMNAVPAPVVIKSALVDLIGRPSTPVTLRPIEEGSVPNRPSTPATLRPVEEAKSSSAMRFPSSPQTSKPVEERPTMMLPSMDISALPLAK